MNFLNVKTLTRYCKLPLKFIYWILSNAIFSISLCYLRLPIKKIKQNCRKQNKKVLCVSHVAISFDGRIKKCANQLIELGMEVVLAKPFDTQESKKFEYSGLDKRVRVVGVGLSGVYSHFPCLFDLSMLTYMIFSDADYLHCHDINTAFMGLVASKLTGKILVSDLHEWKSETVQTSKSSISCFQKKIFKICEKFVLTHSDFVITVNEVLAQKLKQASSSDRKIYIIKNMPIPGNLYPYDLKKMLGLPKTAFVAYYVGQLAPYRNLDKIILSIAKCPEVNLVFQGTISDSYRSELINLSERLGVKNRFFFLPPVVHDFIPSACQGADVGIFACHKESKSMNYSLPNKLFEYVMGELPIIAEDVPIVSGYIEKYNLGVLVTSEKPETIQKALNFFLDEKERAKKKKSVLFFKEKLTKNKDNKLVYESIYDCYT